MPVPIAVVAESDRRYAKLIRVLWSGVCNADFAVKHMDSVRKIKERWSGTMARKELVMSEHPYWRTILHDGGPGPMVVAVEETSYAEINGRTAQKEISVFDAMMAEIMDDRNAEKARMRNRRRADRKYKLTPKMRKEQEHMRNWNVCMKMVNYGSWDDIPIVEGRVRSAEKYARADWETEQENIIADAEREAIEAEYRAWLERYEHEKYMRNLNEWLKYA